MVSDSTGEACRTDGESIWDLRKNPWDPPSEKMVILMSHLSYYYKKDRIRYCDYYEFDVDGKPAKYPKHLIYEILFVISDELSVTREWFFAYIATHTNLTENQDPRAVKAMMTKYNPHKK